jgi:transcriptional regulator GlxA family with amidase domain
MPATDPPVHEIVLVGFPDVELLDLAGPFEVLTTAVQLMQGREPPRVVTAAPSLEPFVSRNGLRLQADVLLDQVERADLLVVPGGRGVRPLLDDEAVLAQLRRLITDATLVLSVCTGSLLLAKLGLLDGRPATTHHLSLGTLAELAPTAVVHPDRRWVEDGPLVIAAGVSSGIDGAFHVVERLWGAELASASARHIEYPWVAGDTGTVPVFRAGD